MAKKPSSERVVFRLSGVQSAQDLASPSPQLTLKGSFAAQPVRDSRGALEVAVDKQDLLLLEFEDDVRLWITPDEFRQRMVRGPARDATIDTTIPVPRALEIGEARDRGVTAWVLKALHLFGVDPVSKTAAVLAAQLEKKRLKVQDPDRLLRCSLSGRPMQLTPLDGKSLDLAQPYLLLIHGTLSSTEGSFGALWGATRAVQLQALAERYGDRCLALEHRTLTVTPVENALRLVEQLPAGARLHLLTHSRGGLVGELLCRGRLVVDDPQAELWDALGKKLTGPALGVYSDIRKLEQELVAKQIVVEKLVRVACPALGTTLASERLDRWISFFAATTEKVTGFPLVGEVGDIVAALAKASHSPDALPGVWAQTPSGPLTRLLNAPVGTLAGDLFVVAGDCDPSPWLRRALQWLVDRYFDSDNDLVVNTTSMFGGLERQGRNVASLHRDEGRVKDDRQAVNHFHYFGNADSAQRIIDALTGDTEKLPHFVPMPAAAVPVSRAAPSTEVHDDGVRPVVFVLPGVMGSQLEVDGDMVWLDLPQLMLGGFRKLSLSRTETKQVIASEPLRRTYGALLRFLADSQHVVPFAYDWRRSIREAAEQLARAVRQRISSSKSGRPIRFIAHSMGGLVVRTMIATEKDLWSQLVLDHDARLLMLGTPNRGSHVITELLLGRSRLVRTLALADITETSAAMLDIIREFPGLLELLPWDGALDLHQPGSWARLKSHLSDDERKGWRQPASALLDGSRTLRRLLENGGLDPARMRYVAGHAPATIYDLRLGTDGAASGVDLVANGLGDGRVPWATGIPSGVQTWYVNAKHGDLASVDAAFPAYLELLTVGATTRIPTQPPSLRGLELEIVAPRTPDVLTPTAELVEAEALGGRLDSIGQPAPTHEEPAKVTVVHGHLAFAKDLVVVGHYEGDVIISAERSLDEALSGALRARYDLGLYPGKLESCAVFENRARVSDPHVRPQGALIVGLGDVGTLTAARLARTFTRGLLEYAFDRGQHDGLPDEADAVPDTLKELGVSSVLIGTQAGGISTHECVYALLSGLRQANRALLAAKSVYRFQRLELIELWEDRALTALERLKALQGEPSLADSFMLPPIPTVEPRAGGLRRVTFEESRGWWQRLQILGGITDDGKPRSDGELRFSSITRQARSPVSTLLTQRQLVDQFIRSAIASPHTDATTSQTLFELLLPNRLKEQADDQDDIVLLLDEEAARYPWELLWDRYFGSSNEPFAIRHGLVRQLHSSIFRENVLPARDPHVLVVGDPRSRLPPLPGAQAEAKEVRDLFAATSSGAFDVVHLDRPDGKSVLNALFDKPYRVLHLAGHGVYRHAINAAVPDDVATGMVLGDEMFLTPAIVRQLRAVPELVFINCCHLGYVDGAAQPLQHTDHNLMAANVATELIRMGVRAVVAAAWAVDDRAARRFAATFYGEMLGGAEFGEAIKKARRATYEGTLGVNTWGAYQCYGDPGYRLRNEPSYKQSPSGELVGVAQLIAELENFTARQQARRNSTQERNDLLSRLRLREQEVVASYPEWMKHGGVRTAFGRAYAALRDFPTAVEHLDVAARSAGAEAPLRAYEQLLNYRIRAALRTALGDSKAVAEQRTLITSYTQKLEELLHGPFGETPERHGLVGSAYKRLAMLEAERPRRIECCKAALAAYSSAAAFQGASDPQQATFNVAVIHLTLAWLGATKSRTAATHALSIVRAFLRAHPDDTDFWNAALRVEVDLLEALLAQIDADERALPASLAARYQRALRRGSSKDRDSIEQQLLFLEVMAAAAGRKVQSEQLAKLREQLFSAEDGY